MILPEDAVAELTAAAAVDPGAAPGESFLRKCAVEDAIRRIQWRYPRFFRKEGTEELYYPIQLLGDAPPK